MKLRLNLASLLVANVMISLFTSVCSAQGMREYHRSKEGKLPEGLQFPYPHPKIVGLIFDPAKAATLSDVNEQSVASTAGFLKGDRILRLNQQAITSIADVQWVLRMPLSLSVSLSLHRGCLRFEGGRGVRVAVGS